MASNKRRLQDMLAPASSASNPPIQRGAPYQVGAPQAEAPALAPEAAALPDALQEIARRYIDARRRSGEALLEAARWLSEARGAAEHGEWYLFLEATGTTHDTADRLLNVHRLALENTQFADAIRRNWLGQSVAALLAAPSTPVEVIEETLASEEQPSARAIQRRIRAARNDESKSRNVAGFEGGDAASDDESKSRNVAGFDAAETVLGEVATALETLAAHPDLVPEPQRAWPLLQQSAASLTAIRQTLVQQAVFAPPTSSAAPYALDTAAGPISFGELVGVLARGRVTGIHLRPAQAEQAGSAGLSLVLQVVDGLFDELVVMYGARLHQYALTREGAVASADVAERLGLDAPQAALVAALVRDMASVRDQLEDKG